MRQSNIYDNTGNTAHANLGAPACAASSMA